MNPYAATTKFIATKFSNLPKADLIEGLLKTPLPAESQVTDTPLYGFTGEDSSHRSYDENFLDKDGFVFHHLTVIERKPLASVVEIRFQDLIRERKASTGLDFVSQKDKKELKDEARYMASIDAPVTYTACPLTWAYTEENSGYLLIGDTTEKGNDAVINTLITIFPNLSLNFASPLSDSNQDLHLGEEETLTSFSRFVDFLCAEVSGSLEDEISVSPFSWGTAGKIKMVGEPHDGSAKEVVFSKGCPVLSGEMFRAFNLGKKITNAHALAVIDTVPVEFEYGAAFNSYHGFKAKAEPKTTNDEKAWTRVESALSVLELMETKQKTFQQIVENPAKFTELEDTIKEWIKIENRG